MITLQRTPLFDVYAKYGGKTIDFGGWELPVQFSSIKEEHEAVRTAQVCSMCLIWEKLK